MLRSIEYRLIRKIAGAMLGLLSGFISQGQQYNPMIIITHIVQLTCSKTGHTLHHNGVFSKDGTWLVFDGRDDDTKIGETSTIGLLNMKTGEERVCYKAPHATPYGPGVGAASFSPAAQKIIFIHGLSDANAEHPYGVTRRVAMAVDLDAADKPFHMDARDIIAPYEPGSLRGGTHSHCWSPDGRLISFTYNDAFVDSDMRVVGVMFPASDTIRVDRGVAGNNDGTCYAAVVSAVVRQPRPGSDDIDKAFDECWIGKQGYMNANGDRIPYAIAFQGNVRNKRNETRTELFVVEIDTAKILADKKAVGRSGERPTVPGGLQQRRLTFTEKGISSVRHWLRSSPDGNYIYCLMPDAQNIHQIVRVDRRTGEIHYLTANDFSVDYAFNLNNKGDKLAYIAKNNVFLLDLASKDNRSLTSYTDRDPAVVGAPSFSIDDSYLVFNRYEDTGKNTNLQIYKVIVPPK